jgi:L-iditol 2-dehydrogenase
VSKTLELYLEGPNELKLRQVKDLPEPNDTEVKIKIIYGGICGSDLRVFKGTISYAKYPLRPGHEVLGTIVEAGKDTPYKVGTRVVVFPNTFCGTCEYCLDTKTNICKSKKPLGVATDGVFAQEVIIESKYVLPVPDTISNKRAVLIEPFAVTIHALKKVKITKDTSLAIVGCGTEGLLAISIALYAGAKVTVVDVNKAKFALAKQLGNVRTLQPQEVKDEVFDVVVEAAGVKSAIEQAMQMVKPGGSMIALGITGDAVNMIPIHIVRSEITIYGSIIYTLKDFADAMEYLSDPSFNIEPVVSKIVPCTKSQEAFKDALSGDFAKIVLDFQS